MMGYSMRLLLNSILCCWVLGILWVLDMPTSNAEDVESDTVQEACFIDDLSLIRCIETSDEALEHLKSCAFMPRSDDRHKCANEILKNEDEYEVSRFVYWI